MKRDQNTAGLDEGEDGSEGKISDEKSAGEADASQRKRQKTEKPFGRTVDKKALSNLIAERDLIKKNDWTENDKKEVVNLLAGEEIELNDSNQSDLEIVEFFNALDKQLEKDPGFAEAMDPNYLYIYSFPDQGLNGVAAAPNVLFQYPAFPPVRVTPVGTGTAVMAFQATPANEPVQWQGLVNAAHQALCESAGVLPVNVGFPGARVSYMPNNDRFLLRFANAGEREHFIFYLKGEFSQRFATAVNGPAGFSFLTMNTQAVLGLRRV